MNSRYCSGVFRGQFVEFDFVTNRFVIEFCILQDKIQEILSVDPLEAIVSFLENLSDGDNKRILPVTSSTDNLGGNGLFCDMVRNIPGIRFSLGQLTHARM